MSSSDPVDAIHGSDDVLLEVVVDLKKLVVYRDSVPGTNISGNGMNRAAILDTINYAELSPKQSWRTQNFKKELQEAHDIANLLGSCEHGNILRPRGVWEAKTSAYIMFQLVDGTLSQIPVTELFIVERNAGARDSSLQGLTQHGFKAFRDLVSAVHHVNQRYNDGSAGTSSAGSSRPPPLLPLQLGGDRILYQRIPTGGYHVLVGDFHTTNVSHRSGLPRNPRVQDIQQANWNGLGNYLSTLIGNFVANLEISQLVAVLQGSSVKFDDLMWEPALWDANTRMIFIRELHMLLEMDCTERRKRELSKLPALGLQPCINKLGVQYNEKDLLGSVYFLRNKILAHADDLYREYPGPKEHIGLDKTTIEKLVVKEKPDYMIKLIKQIRQLKWINESPLTRGKTNYMQLFKTT